MGKVIIDGAIVDNEWARLEADALEAGLPDGNAARRP